MFQISSMAAIVLATLIVTQFSVCVVHASSGEIDGVAVVTSVHDGDTFYLDKYFNGTNTVRFADINAAELGQPGSYEARDFLDSLVYNKVVYLDIDQYPNGTYRLDPYGRLICVVYIEHNSTHYENVNEALLEAHHVVISDYPNEFDPSTWTLYVSKQDLIPEFPSFLIFPPLTIITLRAVMAHRRKKTT